MKKKQKKSFDFNTMELPLWARIIFFILAIMALINMCFHGISWYDFHW